MTQLKAAAFLVALCVAPAALARRIVPARTRLYRDGVAPRWPPAWNLAASTIIQPCNYSGFVEPLEFYAQFGVVE